MNTEYQVLLIIISSIIGYLARMKMKSNCCGNTCEIERDDNNNLECIKVIKKQKSSRNITGHI